MARHYASIALRIWTDDTFRALQVQAQWLYLRLLSDTKLSLAGVSDWRPRRFANSADGFTSDEVEAAGETLVKARLIVVDHDTDEVCVRSFIRNDKTLNSIRTAKGVAAALDQVESPLIRGVLSHELHRLESEPDTPSGLELTREFMNRNTPSPHTPEAVSEGVSEGVSHEAPQGVSQGVYEGVSQGVSDRASPRAREKPKPEPEPKPEPQSSRAKPKRPLPDGWEPVESHRAKARELSLDLNTEAMKFKTFHQSKDNRYADWGKAFHTWLTKAAEYTTRQSQPHQSAADRAMQRGHDRHQQIENGQLGHTVSWDDLFTNQQIER